MRSGSTTRYPFLRPQFLLSLLACVLALATLTGPTISDLVVFSSPSAAPVHLLVHSTPPTRDSLYTLATSQTTVALADRGGKGEVMFFPEDPAYSFTVLPVADLGDGEPTSHNATLNSRIEIKLAFWLVCPHDSLKSWIARCESDMLSAMAMWKAEGAGITVGEYKINGVTITPSATATATATASTSLSSIPDLSADVVAQYADFSCGQAGNLVNAVDPPSGFINAFYVQEVHGQSHAGEACLGSLPGNANNAMFLGCTVSPMLLAHELGHLLVLQHTFPKSRGTGVGDGIDWKQLTFTSTGLMYPKIKTNATITEGQIVRLSLEPTSILNRGYGFHNGVQRTQPVGGRNGSGAIFGNKDVPRLDFRIRQD